MRGMGRFLVLAGVLVARHGDAQTLPAEMVVTAPRGVEVRSGPTKEYQATNFLENGKRVVVLRESKDQPGWLAILPPEGSFSWVNSKHVKMVNGRIGYVDLEGGPAPSMPGSSVVNRAPNVESVKIPPGSIVILKDKPHTVDGNTWLIIQPHPTEVRFIPADAVRMAGPGGRPEGYPSSNPLIAQADQAFGLGQVEKAKALYKEAVDRSKDASEKAYCYSRLASLEKAPTTPGHPFHMAAGKAPAPKATDSKTLKYPPQWTSYGILRRAEFERDGQPVYVLESKEKRALLYVVSEPGSTLRDYVGRYLTLYGSITYRSDEPLRTHYLVATHLKTAD